MLRCAPWSCRSDARHQARPNPIQLVEGAEDRRFLRVLVGDKLDSKAAIREIGTVDVSGLGEKERLLAFALLAVSESATIRFLADADFDRLLQRVPPPNVWLTDLRDLEHYLLDDRCLEKVWGVALGRDGVSCTDIRATILANARIVGVLRLMSEAENLCLPFQETDLGRRIVIEAESVTVDLQKLIIALLQNASRSLSGLSAIETRHREWTERHIETPDDDLAHGKDCLVLVREMTKGYGVGRKEASRLMWTSFDVRFVDRYPVLRQVVDYLTGAGGDPTVGET